MLVPPGPGRRFKRGAEGWLQLRLKSDGDAAIKSYRNLVLKVVSRETSISTHRFRWPSDGEDFCDGMAVGALLVAVGACEDLGDEDIGGARLICDVATAVGDEKVEKVSGSGGSGSSGS